MGAAITQPNLWAGPSWAGRRVGLLGGSFNPAHVGHRHISIMALRRLGLDEVWWLVSPQNPLKPSTSMAALRQRVTQAQAAANHPQIIVTALESDLATQFTSDSLRALRRRFPRVHFVWLMGADNLRQISRWRHWQDIFCTVPVAVLPRHPYSIAALSGKAARRFARNRLPESLARTLAKRAPPAWTFLTGPLHPASATAIRSGQAHRFGPTWR